MIIDLADPIFDPPDPTDDYWADVMRHRRNQLLAESDWTQAADNPTGNAQAWATYRQALRDATATWTPSPTWHAPDPPT